MSLCLKLGLLLVLVTTVLGDEADTKCGGVYNATSGTFVLSQTSTNASCVWYIVAEEAGQVMVNFKSLVLGSSNLTVLSGNVSTSPQIVQKTQFTGPMTVISHAPVTKIIFSRGANDMTASLNVNFNTTSCSVNITGQKGVVNSPVYRENSGDVKCSYKISMLNNVHVPVLSFLKWTWTSATLNVTFKDRNSTPIANSDDVLGPAGTKSVTLSMQIKNGTVQAFQMVYQTANKACSGAFKTNSEGTAGTITFPETNDLPIQCYAQIESTSVTKKQILVRNSGAPSAMGGGDSVLFLDGASQSANVVGNLNGGARWFVSSGTKMTMIANLGTKTSRNVSLKYQEDAYSKLYSLSDAMKSATISLDGSKVAGKDVWIKVQSPTMVKTAFNKGVYLANTNTTVTVQDMDAQTLFVFSKATVLFPVDSPIGGALILVSGLNGKTKLDMTVSQSDGTDCNGLYQGTSGMISFKLNKNSTNGCTAVVATGQKDSATIVQLESATLCPNSTVAIFSGTGHTAAKLGTITSKNTGTSLPQIQFPAGSRPRLLWSVVDNSCKTQTLTARYWSVQSVCNSLGSGLTGNVQTPNFPNQYPLNTQCTWPVPAQNNSFLYLSANTVQFGAGHSLMLKNKSKTLATFSGNTLPNDQIFPNVNLSMRFSSKTNDSTKLDTPGQGADVIYKVLACGGHVTNTSTPITNPPSTAPTECIWIIEVPATGANNSVNIVSANFSVTGYDKATKTTLEIRDGGSVRAAVLQPDLTKTKIPTILSRFNFLWIRYVVPASSNAAAASFNFTVKYSVYNCNKTSLCDNGVCLHPDWRCDGVDQCGDNTDEKHCNGTQPIPPPTSPAPHSDGGKKSGVAAYWVVICLLLGFVIGVGVVYLIPRILRKSRLRNYHSFNNTENA